VDSPLDGGRTHHKLRRRDRQSDSEGLHSVRILDLRRDRESFLKPRRQAEIKITRLAVSTVSLFSLPDVTRATAP
jgi:hypothetical protein